MRTLIKTLAITFSLVLLLISGSSRVSAAGWVDHKFVLQLPDGKTKELKGAKMHIFHKQHEAGGATAFTNTCYYPEKEAIGENDGWAAKAKELVGNYHCVTPASCTIIDYGAPYLPKSFNANSAVYARDDAAYFAFYNSTFTDALKNDSPFSYLANSYQNGNIRGFEGARWQGSVDSTATDEKGPVAIVTDQAELDRELNNRPEWGKAGFDVQTPHRWGPGEVFKDPQGGNVLHGQITWALKAPKAASEKPTATLAGKCTNTTPGIPSFTYTFSNIDLKGQEFSYARLFIRLPHDANEAKIIAALGEPYYTNAGTYGYNIKYFDTAPTSFVIDANTPILGKDNKSKATLGQFITNSRASLPAAYTFDIAGILESKSGDTKTLNDYIKAIFQPKFINDECGQGGGGAPMCLDIKILDFGGNAADVTKLQPNQKIKFQCGQVAGVTQYKFRVLELNTAGQIGKTVDMQQYPGRVSVDYTIPQAGKFLAQCAICPNGQCQAFENTGLSSGQPNPATPVPSPGSAGACADNGYACITTGGCNTSLGWKNMPQYSCPTGQGCCALK